MATTCTANQMDDVMDDGEKVCLQVHTKRECFHLIFCVKSGSVNFSDLEIFSKYKLKPHRLNMI